MQCPFCNFKDEIKYRLLEETENFYLIPDLGAFIEGYVLIISKKHYENLSQLEPELMEEIKTLEEKVKKFVTETYNTQVLEFEHGDCELNGKKAGGCINHLHLAMVATNEELLSNIENDNGQGKKINKFFELKDLHSKMVSYLLYKKNNEIFFWDEIKVPSQYVRRLLAQKNNANFDWRTQPHPENVEIVKEKWTKWANNNVC